MNSPNKMNNLIAFEKNISQRMFAFLLIAMIITTFLFTIIHYLSKQQQNYANHQSIETAISNFQAATSEKLSIIASSTLFIDFLQSGANSQKELEPRFLTELLPLKSSGITGFVIRNDETHSSYQSGDKTDHFITLNLCYLADTLDSQYGNCIGSLQLFFAEKHIQAFLNHYNNTIKPCTHCTEHPLSNKNLFGHFTIKNQKNFWVAVSIHSPSETISLYYVLATIILIGLTLYNKAHLKNQILKKISKPLNELITQVKNNDELIIAHHALDEILYLQSEMHHNRLQISKIKEYEKNAEIGLLAASVAHDIQSPLAAMEMTLSSISHLKPIQHSLLSRAIQNVKDIANNLLEKYRHPETSDIHPIHCNLSCPIELQSFLKQLILSKEMEWQKNPCLIQFEIDHTNDPMWISASPTLLRRTLSNLLNNAYEALITNRHILISISRTEQHVSLTIKDHGHGIPPQKLKDYINGQSSKHTGNALGLKSAIHYILSIGANFYIDSLPQQGTCITLTFPFLQKTCL